MKILIIKKTSRLLLSVVAVVLMMFGCQSSSQSDGELHYGDRSNSLSVVAVRGIDAVNFTDLPRLRIAGGGIHTGGRPLDSGQSVKVTDVAEYRGIIQWVISSREVRMLRRHIVESADRLRDYDCVVGFAMMYVRSIYQREEMQVGCLFIGSDSCKMMSVGEGDSSVVESRLVDSICSVARADLSGELTSYSHGDPGDVDGMGGQGYFVLKTVLPTRTTCVVVSYDSILDLMPEAEWLKQFNDGQRRANRAAGAILSAFRAMRGRNRYPQ